MSLTQEDIIRTLLAARTRLLAAAWVVVRDANASEDIFQNLTVKAIGGGAVFEREAALISWGFVTARHEALNWVRDRRNQALVLHGDVLDLLDAEWAKADPASGGERVAALQECVGKLPGDARRLVELRYYDGQSCGEVASALGLGLEAVYQRLSRLHRSLRQCIEQRLADSSPRIAPEAP
jgi:RNA polymerase sigma-70 factor (ECF subfamily)